MESEKTECRLPPDKIVKINTALISAMHRQKITFRSPQSLIGLLNFACMVVCPSRAFLRHLVDLTLKMVSPFHFIILICEARTDLQAWRSFIETFNGKSVFLADTWVTSDHLKLFTDGFRFIRICSSVWKFMVCKDLAITSSTLSNSCQGVISHCTNIKNLGEQLKKN